MNPICCPECHAILEIPREGQHTCPGCNQPYSVEDGVVDFTPSNHFYWGEITQEQMRRVNQEALTRGWYHSVTETIHQATDKDLTTYLVDDIRVAGIFHYYDPQMNEACADLGSGWGQISFGLSRFYQHVYSIDGVAERLQFQAIRAQQDGVTNLTILKSNMHRLPLGDNSMSAVVVNGLLEWIGLSDTVTDPRQLQIQFLKEVYRVLKPGGKLFIGIENRTGVQFFFGSTDHSGLAYTSLLPRWAASRVVRSAKKRESDALVFSGAETSYRTLTYTRWGYQKLIQAARFLKPAFYWTWPSYNYPRASGTLDGESIRAYLNTAAVQPMKGLRSLALKLARLLPNFILGGLISVFAPHFLIVASKGQQRPGLQEAVLGSDRPQKFLRLTLETNEILKSVYLLLKPRPQRKVNVSLLPLEERTSYQIDEEEAYQTAGSHHLGRD